MPSLVGLTNKRNVNSRSLWVNIIEGSIEEIIQVPTYIYLALQSYFQQQDNILHRKAWSHSVHRQFLN
jgi:hypothetical protein